MTKEPATDRFAARFHAAGYSVLAFDHRHLGESGGTPRQVVRIREQLADWEAALDFAASLPSVAAAKSPGGASRSPRGTCYVSRPGPRASGVWPR